VGETPDRRSELYRVKRGLSRKISNETGRERLLDACRIAESAFNAKLIIPRISFARAILLFSATGELPDQTLSPLSPAAIALLLDLHAAAATGENLDAWAKPFASTAAYSEMRARFPAPYCLKYKVQYDLVEEAERLSFFGGKDTFLHTLVLSFSAAALNIPYANFRELLRETYRLRAEHIRHRRYYRLAKGDDGRFAAVECDGSVDGFGNPIPPTLAEKIAAEDSAVPDDNLSIETQVESDIFRIESAGVLPAAWTKPQIIDNAVVSPYSDSEPLPAATPLPAAANDDSGQADASFCIDIDAVASAFGVSTRTIERWVEQRKIPPPAKFGRRRLWSKDILVDALRERHESATDDVQNLIEKHAPTGRGAV